MTVYRLSLLRSERTNVSTTIMPNQMLKSQIYVAVLLSLIWRQVMPCQNFRLQKLKVRLTLDKALISVV